MFKFTDLTPEAKKVAVEGFIEDARSFDFGWKGMNEDNVADLLSSKRETHRYDSKGIVIGMVSYDGSKEYFTEGGMY